MILGCDFESFRPRQLFASVFLPEKPRLAADLGHEEKLSFRAWLAWGYFAEFFLLEHAFMPVFLPILNTSLQHLTAVPCVCRPRQL